MAQRNIITPDYFYPEFRSGRYYLIPRNTGNGTTTGTVGTALNTLTYSVFNLTRPINIDRICINVAAAVAGSLARFGIYSNNNNGLPANLIVDAGEVSCASTGSKEAVVNTFLFPGIYWMAINSSGALPNLQLAAGSNFECQSIYGAASASSTLAAYSYRNSQAYGALPTNAPVGSLSDSGNNNILYWLRAS